MGVTEEGTYMSDENKKEAGLPGEKRRLAYLFWSPPIKNGFLIDKESGYGEGIEVGQGKNIVYRVECLSLWKCRSYEEFNNIVTEFLKSWPALKRRPRPPR